MNVFPLPAWGSRELPRALLPSLLSETAFLFLSFFFFCTKVAAGSVLGDKAGLGVEGPLHLLRPGLDSVSVCEKTIFSLKQ